MKASIVDLRYKTNEVLKALERNENVTVLYHGKIKAVITPVRAKKVLKVKEHPLFGIACDSEQSVLDELDNLRQTRHAL
jgi:antitoxin (DNA-binding transcriptional repressor) of toxin-antitoxin stability system